MISIELTPRFEMEGNPCILSEMKHFHATLMPFRAKLHSPQLKNNLKISIEAGHDSSHMSVVKGKIKWNSVV